MKVNRSSIIVIGVFVEGFLAVLYFAWAYLHNVSFNFIPSPEAFLNSVVYTLPLILVGFVVFGPLADRFSFMETCVELREKVVRPLAQELSPQGAFIISLCAGFGEELFFRGLMLHELGTIISSLVFALIHFGFAVRRYWLPAVVYFIIGLYFCFIALEAGLWSAILTHFLYDFVALLYMGRKKSNVGET